MFQFGPKKFLWLKKLKALCRGHLLFATLAVKKLLELLTKKSQKTNKKESRTEKVIKKKDNKVYVKCKGHDNSFNSWIDKKDIVI